MLTKEQWAKIKEELSNVGGMVVIDADGYQISFYTQLIRRSLKILVYVNGVMKMDWMVKGGDQASRFMRAHMVYVNSKKLRAAWLKDCGGARCSKKNLEQINKKFMMWAPEWNSPASLIAHLKKNNQAITQIAIGWREVQEKMDLIKSRYEATDNPAEAAA